MKVTLTAELIDQLKTRNGGYDRKTTEALGVPWPLPSGWRKNLIGKTVDMPDNLVARLNAEPVYCPQRKPNNTPRQPAQPKGNIKRRLAAGAAREKWKRIRSGRQAASISYPSSLSRPVGSIEPSPPPKPRIVQRYADEE